MKKLLLAECILASFFLVFLFVIFGHSSLWENDVLEVDSGGYLEEKREKDTIWMDAGKRNDSFSPLEFQTAGERNILSLCFSNLLIRNERGERSNHPVSDSWEKEEQFAHISYREDAGKHICYVTVAVNPKAETASGEAVTAEDIMFNYYLRADASSGLVAPFGGVEIVGQQEYYYGTAEISKRQKEIAHMLKKPTQALKKRCSEEIIEKELARELQWVKSLYQDESYAAICAQYQHPQDLFAYYFAYQTKYSSANKDENRVFAEIVAQYDGDYRKLSKITQKDYQAQAERIALTLLQQEKNDTVKNISGIRKIDTHTVEFAVKGNRECVDRLCNLWILPLSEYGEKKQFDGKENFGYRKGEAENIVQKAAENYNGTGAYYLKKVEGQKMLLEWNPHYYGKKAAIKEIVAWNKQYQDYKEIVEDLLEQKIDLVFVQDSKDLDSLLKNRATGAASRIRKVSFTTMQPENCFVYRTSCVNTPSIPDKISESHTLFEQFNLLKTNSRK